MATRSAEALTLGLLLSALARPAGKIPEQTDSIRVSAVSVEIITILLLLLIETPFVVQVETSAAHIQLQAFTGGWSCASRVPLVHWRLNVIEGKRLREFEVNSLSTWRLILSVTLSE